MILKTVQERLVSRLHKEHRDIWPFLILQNLGVVLEKKESSGGKPILGYTTSAVFALPGQQSLAEERCLL